MTTKKGKIIVLEGIDGSGKSTQHKLLVNYLKSKKLTVKTIKFPRHKKPFFGNMVDEYLNGEFGQATKIHSKLASILFALDRFEVKDKIKKWVQKGYYFIPDRYLPSNLGHQLGKIINQSDKKKKSFIEWDETMEYKVLGIPKPDLVIYLKADLNIILNLLKKRGRGDQHENDIQYLKNSQLAYNYVAKLKKWSIVDCSKNKKMLSVKEIHKKIINIVNKKIN